MVDTASHTSTRGRVFEILERGRRDEVASRAFDIAIVALILANVAAAVIGTVSWIGAAYGEALRVFDTVCVAVFMAEYAARLWTAPEHPALRHLPPVMARARLAATPLMIVDLVAILPFFIELAAGVDLRVIRLLRIVRFYRLARYVPALATIGRVVAAEWRPLLGSAVLFLGLLLFTAVLMNLAEGDLQPDRLGDVPSAMWWAIVTLSTVGYGDVVPITPFGKIVAGLTMLLGIMFIALPVGIIATGFHAEIHRRDFVVSFAMVARVPLFSRLDAPTIARLVGLLTARKVPAGDVIVSKGEEADGMYFIASGQVEVELPQGSVHLGEGDFFGEIALLSPDARRTATVTAVRASELLQLHRRDFQRLMARHADIAEAIQRVAHQRRGEIEAQQKALTGGGEETDSV